MFDTPAKRHFDRAGRAAWLAPDDIVAIAAQLRGQVRLKASSHRDGCELGSARRPRSFLMNGIEKQAAFYRGYLPDDRSLVPVTVLLSTTVALWLLVYCVNAVSCIPQNERAAVAASARFVRDPGAAGSLTPPAAA